MRLPKLDSAWIAIVFSCAFLLFSEGAITNSDGMAMFHMTGAMVDRHALDVPRAEGGTQPGRHGKTYIRYGPALPALSIPLYGAGKLAGRVAGHTDQLEEALVSSMMPIVSGLLVWALYLLGLRLGAGRRESLLLAAGAVVGTYCLAYTKDFFSEPLGLLGIVVAIERTLARRPVPAGFAVALAGLTRAQNFVLTPFVLLVVLRREGSRRAALAAVPMVAAVGTFLAYNWLRFGDVTNFGYADQGFSTSILNALRGFTLNPAKSLFLFAPIIVLMPLALGALWRSAQDAVLLVVGNFVVTLALAATYEFWEGGWSWGPRYLLSAVIPALPLVAVWSGASVTRLRVCMALLAAGFVISLPTLLVSVRAQQLDHPVPRAGPAIARQMQLVPQTARETMREPYRFIPHSGAYNRSFALWQVNALRLLGRAGWGVVLLGSATLILAAGAALVRS